MLALLEQWALFSGVVAAVGCATWISVVARMAAPGIPTSHAADLRMIERRVGTVGAFVAGALLPVWALRMVVQVIAFRDPFVPLGDDVSFLLFEMTWGTVWMAQGAILVLLAGAFLLGRPAPVGGSDGPDPPPSPGQRPRSAGVARAMTALLVAGLVATLALSSHAMGVESRRFLAVAADGIHLLAAGAWIGSLGIILTAGRTGHGLLFSAQLRSFSATAKVSVSVLVVMGVALSWTHLRTVSDLWTEVYGRYLSAKIALAMVVFLTGLWNWRRGLPALDTRDGPGRVQRLATVELSLALGVLLITSILVHSPKP